MNFQYFLQYLVFNRYFSIGLKTRSKYMYDIFMNIGRKGGIFRWGSVDLSFPLNNVQLTILILVRHHYTFFKLVFSYLFLARNNFFKD